MFSLIIPPLWSFLIPYILWIYPTSHFELCSLYCARDVVLEKRPIGIVQRSVRLYMQLLRLKTSYIIE